MIPEPYRRPALAMLWVLVVIAIAITFSLAAF
jgi:hypothetical protein